MPANVEITYRRPRWLYPKQFEAIYDPARFVFIEASTKSGKTVGCISWLAEKAVGGVEGNEFWWVAPIYAQAKIAYRRMKRFLPRDHYKFNDSDLRITLVVNGAIIVFKGSDNPDSLYGEDVWACVVDEASRCKEEAWVAIRSTLTATRGPVRIIGNVKGRKNWAYRLGQLAKAGHAGYAYHRITAVDAIRAGVLVLEEIEDAQMVLTPDVFNELYMAIATEDGANPFGLVAIENCVAPIADAEPVVWGWDLGRKQDWTVGVGLDEFKRTCRFTRFQRSWPETTQAILNETGAAKALVDGTGVGDPIVQDLQKLSDEDNFESFIFTSKSKQQLIEGLCLDVQQGAIIFPDGDIRDEMENFEYVHTRTGIKYEAPPGLHDDCVCALALARLRHEQGGWAPAAAW